MKGSSKGQVALEFLVYAGVFLLIAVSAYTLTYFTQRSEVALRESQMFREFGYKFQYAAIVAYRGGEGFTYDLYFPQQIDGKPYELMFQTNRGTGVSTTGIIWNGTSSEYAYLYTIPYAAYEEGDGGCFKASPSGGSVVSIDVGKAGGRLLFTNLADQGTPTIRIDCGVVEE
ncbi:MAG: hypothetical protein PHQ80_03395 [Candidatus ainarchaeum sp.]|nr:hypothetical protein [Candidatus ainarchaeum sp.]MDD5096537.1 hypothetical protein [Candidatus ainarchaeum sp.]